MRAPKRALGMLGIGLALALAFFIVPAVTDSGQQASADAPFQLIYYDGHMHTKYSDGTGTVESIKATALARGLSAVIITDHCKDLTLKEWKLLVKKTREESDANFLALPGFEITGDEGAFLRAHMNAYNAPDPFVGDDALEQCPEEAWPSPPNPAGTGPNVENLERWVDYVHSQGGIVNHNHPSGDTRFEYGVNNVELYNQGHVDDIMGYALDLGIPADQAWGFAISINNFAIYGETSPAPYKSLNELVEFPGIPVPVPLRYALFVATYMLTGIGQIVGWSDPPNPMLPGDLNSWDELLMAYVHGEVDHPVFGVANSDAHNTKFFEDPLESNVGIAKNGLYVEELTAEDVYTAIERGHGFATTGPSIAFDVNGEMMGDTADILSGGSANLHLSVKAETAGFVLAKIDIYKNGLVWKTIYPSIPIPRPAYSATLVDNSVTEDGYYRMEVVSQNAAGTYQFAYSNPVFVNVP